MTQGQVTQGQVTQEQVTQGQVTQGRGNQTVKRRRVACVCVEFVCACRLENVGLRRRRAGL